jgi:hypothetical protein
MDSLLVLCFTLFPNLAGRKLQLELVVLQTTILDVHAGHNVCKYQRIMIPRQDKVLTIRIIGQNSDYKITRPR